MKHVVMFSGGIASWATAKRVADRHGTDCLTLLFADTGIEDEDVYRFLHEAASNVGGELVIVREGRTPWELFQAERMIANNRVPFCSRMLKQEPARKWVKANTTPEDAVLYVGIDWTEAHRLDGARRGWAPWRVEAPLCEKPLLTKPQLLDLARAEGLEPPRQYALGFPHANCGGFCVRQGQAGFAHLLKVWPERYRHHEEQEEALRELVGKDVAILKEQRNGVVRPLTLRTLRKRVEANQQLDLLDWGGCGCFLDEGQAA